MSTIDLKNVSIDRAERNESDANTHELFRYYRSVLESKKNIRPQLKHGPIDPRKIVYSLNKNFVYTPVRSDLGANARLITHNALIVKADGESYIFSRGAGEYDGKTVWASMHLNPDGPDGGGYALDTNELYLEVCVESISLNN